MKIGIKNSCLLLALALLSTTLCAQTNPCATNLKDANQKTEKGRFDEAIVLIKNTLANCELSKNDKIQANKLLVVNYLAIDNLEEAEATAAIIMKIDPNYEPDKLRDEPEVIELFQKYKPTVVIKAVVFGGINFSHVSASKTYSIVNDDDSEGLDNYESVTGFQIRVGVEFRLFSSFWIQPSFMYRKSGYSIAIPNVQGRTIFYTEALNYIDIPIAAKYYFGKGNLLPFVQAGVNFSFLNAALGELSRDDINDIVDRLPQRNMFYVGYFGGAGLAYNHKAFSVQASFCYLWVPQNLNKEGTRYNSPDAVFNYYYLDNDFTMNNMVFNLGFTYALGYKNVLTGN
jgi:hypothetical protein